MNYRPLGQAFAVAQIGIAAGNVALDYSNATQLQQMQTQFQKKLDSDSAMIDYIKNMVDRFTSESVRLAKSGRYQPNTTNFDSVLSQILADQMKYQGNCNVNIYNPINPANPNQKTIWATINRSGYITPPTNAPADVGAIWSSGCQSAQDQSSIAYIKGIKDTQQFNVSSLLTSDIGTMNLFLRIGLGVILVVLMILLVKTQNIVIWEQKDLKYIKKKKELIVAKK